MPVRFLRPEITTSDRWNSVSWMAQSFYIRLITLVDDYGRYHADPRLLKSHAFPYADTMTADAVVGLCREVSEAGLVLFYEVENGARYLQLNKWQETARSKKSKFPAVDSNCKHLKADDFICKQMYPPSPSSAAPLVLANTCPPVNGGGVVKSGEFKLDVQVKEKPFEPSEIQKRFNRIFKRRDSTHWSPKEIKALRVIEPIAEADMKEIERYYGLSLPKEKDYRRRDMLTLLNNFNGEVDRARSFKAPAMF